MLKARRTLAIVSAILIIGTVAVGSFALVARGFRQTPVAPSPPQAATEAIPAMEDEGKEKLELRKLRAEIRNLQAETKKALANSKRAEWDSSTAWMAWIAPIISSITLVILATTLVVQRQTALDVQKAEARDALQLQEKQGQAALDLQKAEARDALQLQEKQGQAALDLQTAEACAAREIKVVDLVMSSRSPALAQLKAELLGSLYREEVRSPFLKAVKEMTDMREFPGDLGLEMRMKVFQELVSKYDEPADIVLLARKTLLGGKGWLDELVPPTPRKQNS